MIKTNIILVVEDGNNIYNIGDKVRVLMKPSYGYVKGHEYMGRIIDIQEKFMTVDTTIVSTCLGDVTFDVC